MNDTQHINGVQIDATLKGYNLALQWQAKVIHVKIDLLMCIQLTLFYVNSQSSERRQLLFNGH